MIPHKIKITGFAISFQYRYYTHFYIPITYILCTSIMHLAKLMFFILIQHAQAPEALGVQRLALWQEEGVAGPK